MKTELKPCPFCGGEAKLMGLERFKEYRVYCHDCGVRTDDFYPKHRAVEAWNRRCRNEDEPEEV